MKYSRTTGFTLIELMIVVAVIAILAAIAYPSYTEQVQRGKRAEAQSVLTEAAQWMERYYTQNNAYDQDVNSVAVALPVGLQTSPRSAVGGAINYNVTLSAINATAFTLTATAVNSMNGDRCGDYSLTSTGQKSVNTSATDCWSR